MNREEKILQDISIQRKWFNINTETETAEILIYDRIGASFWDEGLSSKDFIKSLSDIEKTHKAVNIRINSPGGLIHDGLSIYNHLAQSKLDVTVYIDGLAASSASFIAMAGKKIIMPESAEMMIHDPWAMVAGSADDMRKEATHLDSLKSIIANIYTKKTGKSEAEIFDLMSKQTWMNGKEAKSMGFCDELVESKCAACVFDLDNDLLPNLPDGFIKLQNSIKKRALEKSYRDEGLSQSEAKARLSEDKKQRDAEEAQKNIIHTKAINLITKELACLTK